MLLLLSAFSTNSVRLRLLDRKRKLVYDESMNTKCCHLLLCLVLVMLVLVMLVLVMPGVQADPLLIPAAPAPPRLLSLAGALNAMPDASVADGSVVLTVQSYQVMPVPAVPASVPPADGGIPAEMPPATVETVQTGKETVQTPETLAVRYGRSLQVFSHVLALAPPLMTVLNTDPALADVPLAQLAGQHPLPFLLGTLTQGQIQQLSTTGLGFADLSPDQQALFQAALPVPFEVVPASAKMPGMTEAEAKTTGPEREEINARVAEEARLYKLNTRTVPEAALRSSLRLYGFVAPEFTFDGAGNSLEEGYSDNGFKTTGPDTLTGQPDMFAPGGSGLQALLRSDLPNAPKPGDLDWNRSVLTRAISLEGIKTVDDLTARLAKATGLELYADTRYGSRTLQARGDLKTGQPAGDVMQALALCVCGAWRRVGAAFVLTDDVQGLGTRQEFLHEMVQAWSNRLSAAGQDVGGHLAGLDWMHALRFEPGDIGALPPAQMDSVLKEHHSNYGNLLWKDLPTPLQAGLHGQLTRHFDGDGMTQFEATAQGIAKSLTPDFKVGVSLNLRLGVALPDTGIMTLGDAYRVRMPEPPAAPGAEKPQINSVALDKPLRGVLCAPKTPDEARAVVALLPRMGLNTLFLDVFTNGRAYFPNTALPPDSKQAGGVLQAALDAAQAAHIPVYAVMDLLCWRKDGAAVHPQPWPAHFAEDLTITGEAPDRMVQRQLAAHTVRADFDREYEMVQHGSQGWVSPLDPRVNASLPAVVHDLAGTKGLAGLVLEDTAALGYLGVDNDFDDENISLGYTPDNRLAYLRAHHTDPIDLLTTNENLQLWLPTEGWQSSFEASVPSFEMSGGLVSGDWNVLRANADKALLASCYGAAKSAAPALPLFMRERRMGITLDPWTDPKTLNQVASLNSLDHPFHLISPASIEMYSYGPVEKAHPGRFVWEASSGGPAGDDGKRAGGEVFDLVTGGSPENLPDTLDKLNLFLKKP